VPEERPNTDQLIADMIAFDQEGQKYMSPAAYAKIRPVHAPQLYGWAKRDVIVLETCQCGRRVLNVEEVDEVLRAKGKLPPLLEDEDPEDRYGYYQDRDETGRAERVEEEL
jgi:hypothetical protein